jgi:ABC-type nitrate/sulfonate/bicarbonate transport system substrate-binding protein
VKVLSSGRSGLIGLLCLALAFVTTGCAGDTPQQGQDAKIPMTFTGAGNLSWLNVFVAEDEGIFDKHGIESTVRVFDVGFLGTEAVLAGEAQTAGSVEFPLLGLLGQGAGLVVPAVVATAEDQRIVVKDSIQKPEDLRGKKIGLIGGSAFEYSFQEYLNHFNIPKEEVEFVNVDAAEQVAVMARGDIDGFLNVEPVVSRALNSVENVHVLKPGTEEVYTTRILLQMNKDWVNSNPDGVKKALAALMEANDFIKANRDKAAEIGAKWTKSDKATVTSFLEDAKFDYNVHYDAETRQSMEKIANWMIQNGKLEKMPDLNQVFVTDHLKEVAPEQVKE